MTFGFFTIHSDIDWKSLIGPSGWTTTYATEGQPVEPPELPDADITPDEAEPLPPDEPVKTDPIPEETE